MKRRITTAPLTGMAAFAVLFTCSRAASLETPVPHATDQVRIGAEHTATIYYVSGVGSDVTGMPDSPARPYRSPGGAYADIPVDITTGKGDHVIQIADSATYGQLTMTPRATDPAHRIVLRAAPGMTPTMDAHSTTDGSRGRADNNLTLRIVPNYVVVQGLRFTNTNLATDIARQEVMVRLDGSNSVIDGNFFDGNGRTPTRTDIFLVICNNATENVISGNRFDYSGGKSLIHITASCGGGSPGRQIIRNNALSRFGNNPQAICAAINFGGSRGTFAGNHSIVENNTIYDNGGGCYGLLDTNTSSLTVRNNIFARITGHRYAVGCNVTTGRSSGVAYNSVMFGNTHDAESDCPSGGWTLSGFYGEDPYFVDTAATPPDLHLESTSGSRRNGSSAWTPDSHCSAAIDRASVTDSFDLEPSPNGGRRNLGAYGNTREASKSCRLDPGGVHSLRFDWIKR